MSLVTNTLLRWRSSVDLVIQVYSKMHLLQSREMLNLDYKASIKEATAYSSGGRASRGDGFVSLARRGE